MKKKSITMLVFSLVLIVSLMNVSALAAPSVGTTTATVAFQEGTAEFGDANLGGLNNMDIDFGTRDLPIGAQTYEAVDHDHTLRIIDARSSTNAGDWDVTVALSAFASITPANSFTGTITFTSPVTTVGLTATDPVVVTSGASSVPVVTASAGLTKDNYDTTWQKANIKLSFDAAAAATITTPATYTATLTWTLDIH